VTPDPKKSAAADVLSAHLWDLRSQAEAKLRCLTRVQQLLDEYALQPSNANAPDQRTKILEDVTDLVTISGRLQATSAEALEAARELQ
jgi:hypothetical protein